MGNYRFRLSDMVPSAWFYKLKDMGKSRSRSQNRHVANKKQPPPSSSSSSISSHLQQTKTRQPGNSSLSYERKSYYLSRNLSPCHNNNEMILSKNPNKLKLTEPPRKSTKSMRRKRRSSVSPRIVNSSGGCSCRARASLESVSTKHDHSTPEDCPNSPFSFSSSTSSSEPESSVRTFDALIMSASCHNCTINNNNDHVAKIDLPQIITRPKKLEEHKSFREEVLKQEESKRFSGVKLRTKSPRIGGVYGSRKSVPSSTNLGKRSVGESFAVVKTSKDPQKDFKESMVEMIVENNIRTSKDLEELLACYLSLNSDHYHDLIIKVFKQIWFDIITDIRMK